MLALSKIKNYLRIDHDFDDELLKDITNVATSYVDSAIDFDEFESQKFDSKYEFCITLLIGHWYENRLATSEVNLSAIPFGVTALLNQLRNS